MKKIFLIILFISIADILFSQTIPNGSFEQVDSAGNLMNWKIISGKVTRNTARIFYGTPFIATDSSYFITMENDTSTATIKPAVITNTFPVSSIYHAITFHEFYAPKFTSQRWGIEVLFTKWKNNSRDTVIYYWQYKKPALDSNNNLSVNWFFAIHNFEGGYRDTATIPDTATITFHNDIVSPFATTTIFFLDNIKMSLWHLGVNEISKNKDFKIYPNPVKGLLNIEYETNVNFEYHISDISGKEILSGNKNYFQSGNCQIDLSLLNNGIYFLRISKEGQIVNTSKIVLMK